MSTPLEQPINRLLEVLLDAEKQLPAGYPYRLSDLNHSDLNELKTVWPQIPAWRRIAVMEDIQEIGENDYTLSFEALARYCIEDSEPRVRELAVQTLWDYELPDLIPALLKMLQQDANTEVRAAAATAFGKYIYLGEIEELPLPTLKQLEDTLIEVVNGRDNSLVRRRALESLGFSSREEVKNLILQAYYSENTDWLISALFAMARSANKNWKHLVLEALANDDPQVIAEAVRAAGELEISDAVPVLLEYLNHEDRDVRLSAIWALSQTGGEGVQQAFETLYDESEDPEEVELLEDALDNLAFTEDMEMFALLDFSENDEDESELFDDYEDDRDLLN